MSLKHLGFSVVAPVLLVGALAVEVISANAQTGTNLVVNGGFERDIAGWESLSGATLTHGTLDRAPPALDRLGSRDPQLVGLSPG